MVEMLLGSVIGAVISVLLAEWYQRRASKEFDRRMSDFEELHADLRCLIHDVQEEAEQAKTHAYNAYLQSVGNTPEHPDFPFK